MNKLPTDLLLNLKDVKGFDEKAFVDVHASGGSIASIRLNPLKTFAFNQFLPVKKPVPWCKHGCYLTERPSFTFDPLLHAGAYYVQEASSMFLEQAILQTTDTSRPLYVLDLCAAPGGKSTHLLSLISKESVLVCNEVIKSRVNILLENITKWGADNCIVTNNDPKDFSVFEGLFDVIVVDAPCSGSGLFRKDNEAIEEWSIDNVLHCAERQHRILQDVWPALKPGGVLVYSTCSYSPQEDEDITDILTEITGAESIPLTIENDWGIVAGNSPKFNNHSYRFYPNLLDGEGFFLSCFRKKNDDDDGDSVLHYFPNKPDKKLVTLVNRWIGKSNLAYYQHEDQLFAMTPETMQLFLNMQKKLNIRKAGFKAGDIVRSELIPGHAMALSAQTATNLKKQELTAEQAIAFLRRQEFEFTAADRGWLIVTYKGFALGWVKNLGNRINNYYPKEWRIRS